MTFLTFITAPILGAFLSYGIVKSVGGIKSKGALPICIFLGIG